MPPGMKAAPPVSAVRVGSDQVLADDIQTELFGTIGKHSWTKGKNPTALVLAGLNVCCEDLSFGYQFQTMG